MSLRIKLVVIIAFVALVPLSISTLTTLSIHQQAFDSKISEIHRQQAQSGAALVQIQLDTTVQTLSKATRSIQWTALSEDERDGALWLLYRQLDDIAVVSLMDEKGRGMGPSIYLTSASLVEELKEHPLATMPILESFSKQIPFERAKKRGSAIGEAFITDGAKAPLIPVAISIPGRTPSTHWVVAVGISLNRICNKISSIGTSDTNVFLVDSQNRIACRSNQDEFLSLVDPALRNKMSRMDSVALEYRNAKGEDILATIAPLSRGWNMVVAQPVKTAFSSSRRMRLQTIFWIIMSVIVAVATGLVMGRSISRPLAQLTDGADELAKGHFKHRLHTESGDEIGKLSLAFNHMGDEIEKRDAEIRTWNEELLKRVDEKTDELKDVQKQLLQSQKIAAVSSLGAGVAHEINNPLTGIIGLTQVIMASAEKNAGLKEYYDLLSNIEKESLRIKDIVATLQAMSQNYAGEDFSSFDINKFINLIVDIIEEEFSASHIVIERNYGNDVLQTHGNQHQLKQAFLELLKNSRIAMPKGGRITISTSQIEDRATRIVIGDTGKGISKTHLEHIFEPFFTTKDDWQGEGLGLTLAFRIIEEHHGTIRADSTVGQGTTMTIVLPSAKGGSYLL